MVNLKWLFQLDDEPKLYDLLQLVDRFLFHGRFTAFLNAEMAQWAQLSAA